MSDVFDYAEAQSDAEELIAYFAAGTTGAIRRTVVSGVPWDPGSQTTTVTDYPCVLVQTNYSDREIDGSLIKATDRRVYVSTDGLSITPTVSDKIVVGGVPLEIVRVIPLEPAATVICWEIQART